MEANQLQRQSVYHTLTPRSLRTLESQLFCLVQCEVLVAVPIHDSTDDIDFVIFQLHDRLVCICGQVHHFVIRIVEGFHGVVHVRNRVFISLNLDVMEQEGTYQP